MALRLAGIFVMACVAAGGTAAGANLDTPMTATWTGIGLRAWAGSIAADGVTIFVDRRLDPDATLSLECRGEPLRDVVARAAAQTGGESVALASVLRLVPHAAGDLLRRADQARNTGLAKLPSRQRSLVATRRPWRWPDGAMPAELVAALAAEAGVAIDGIDSLPHDHLPAAALPPLSLAERLDLVLGQYDRRVAWRSGDAGRPAGRIIPLTDDLPPVPEAAKRTADDRRKAGGTPPAAPPGTRETFSLQVAAPLEQVLVAIATRLGLTLDLDRESLRRRGVAAGEIVKATVKDANRDELLDAVLDPLQLGWQVDAGMLRVFAKPDQPATAVR